MGDLDWAALLQSIQKRAAHPAQRCVGPLGCGDVILNAAAHNVKSDEINFFYACIILLNRPARMHRSPFRVRFCFRRQTTVVVAIDSGS